MEVIRDRTGKVIQRSRNLAGIRRFMSTNIVTTMDISRLPEHGGKLSILFRNGDTFETNFASEMALRWFVQGWRNAYGCPLLVNGQPAGTLSYSNPVLKSEL